MKLASMLNNPDESDRFSARFGIPYAPHNNGMHPTASSVPLSARLGAVGVVRAAGDAGRSAARVDINH